MKRKIKKLTESIFFKDEKLPFVEARFVLDSDYHYTEHFHETLSVGAIEHGQVAYRHEDTDYVLKSNELAVVNPFVMHACNPIEKQSRTYHMTYIDTQWCKAIQETLFGNIENYIQVSTVNIEDKELYEEYLNLNYVLLDSEYFYIEKEELLYNFLVKLFKKYCNTNPVNQISNIYSEDLIHEAKNFINKNVNENLTINDMCSHVDLSEFHFIRLFKEVTHTTPHLYLLNLKVNEAKKLISDGVNIAEVASTVGFFDQSHLNRVFKKFVAATPFEYKKGVYKK